MFVFRTAAWNPSRKGTPALEMLALAWALSPSNDLASMQCQEVEAPFDHDKREKHANSWRHLFFTNLGTTPITILAVNSDHGLSFLFSTDYSTSIFWRFNFSVVWVLVWVSSFYGDGGWFPHRQILDLLNFLQLSPALLCNLVGNIPRNLDNCWNSGWIKLHNILSRLWLSWVFLVLIRRRSGLWRINSNYRYRLGPARKLITNCRYSSRLFKEKRAHQNHRKNCPGNCFQWLVLWCFWWAR